MAHLTISVLVRSIIFKGFSFQIRPNLKKNKKGLGKRDCAWQKLQLQHLSCSIWESPIYTAILMTPCQKCRSNVFQSPTLLLRETRTQLDDLPAKLFQIEAFHSLLKWDTKKSSKSRLQKKFSEVFYWFFSHGLLCVVRFGFYACLLEYLKMYISQLFFPASWNIHILNMAPRTCHIISNFLEYCY